MVTKQNGGARLAPDIEHDKAVFKAWMLQLTAAVIGLPTGPRFCLVLQDPPAGHLSKWARALLPPNLEKGYRPGVWVNFRDKDSLEDALRGWIVEIDELDQALDERYRNALERFVVKSEDRVAGRMHPRHTCFVGSVRDPETARLLARSDAFRVMNFTPAIPAWPDEERDLLWAELICRAKENSFTGQ